MGSAKSAAPGRGVVRMRLAEWARRHYTAESRPAASTLYAMARDGQIPGAVKTRSGWWVDTPSGASAHIDARAEEIVSDRVLARALGL